MRSGYCWFEIAIAALLICRCPIVRLFPLGVAGIAKSSLPPQSYTLPDRWYQRLARALVYSSIAVGAVLLTAFVWRIIAKRKTARGTRTSIIDGP